MKFYVECTYTCQTDHNHGIQRVVRNLVRLSISDSRREIIPVRIAGDRLYVAALKQLAPPDVKEAAKWKELGQSRPKRSPVRRLLRAVVGYVRNVLNSGRWFVSALLPYPPLQRFLTAESDEFGLSGLLKGLLPGRRHQPAPAPEPPMEDEAVSVEPGDVLVMLDASWELQAWPVLSDFKRAGGSVVWVAYDLIPRSYPKFYSTYFTTCFTRWVDLMQLHADAILCISRTTAETIKKELPPYITDRVGTPRISYFWLGSELDGSDPETQQVRPELRNLAAEGEAPFYFYVSTIEPRKNHAYALDAFELLWRQGSTARMVFIGRIGHGGEAFADRVKRHPAFGTNLLMYNDVTDTELAWFYETGNGLLFTSIVEGFGLPIVEALQQGVPVFASDIPVFREIGTQGVTFVDLADPASLTGAIAAHMAQGAPRLSAPVDWLDWRQSTEQFWDRLENCLSEVPDRTFLIS